MKNFKISIFICMTLILLNTTVFAMKKTETVEVTYNNIKIMLDGEYIVPTDVNGNIIEPFIIDGTTYLPVRGICEALGLLVDWDLSTSTVILEDNGLLTELDKKTYTGAYRKEVVTRSYIGERISLNGTELIPKDVTGKVVEPFIIEGSTFLPLRAIANAMNLDVEWDGNTNTVILTNKNQQPLNTLMPVYKSNKNDFCFGNTNIMRHEIATISFEKLSEMPSDEKIIEKWNAAKESGEIIAWISEAEWIDGYPKYDLHLASKDGIFYAPKNSSYLFAGYSSVYEINGIENLDVSNVINASYMFSESSNISALNIKNWDTQNMKDMSHMFAYCQGLIELEVGDWNTKNVKNMSGMFGDSKLLKIDVDNWDVSNVKDISYMFWRCDNLTDLNVKNWNVSNVENMESTFSMCTKLKDFHVENWNVSKVTNMQWMFRYANVTSMDLNNWDTSNLEKTSAMFDRCANLTKINLDKWDTSHIFDMSSMFNACSKLEEIDVSKWDISRVHKIADMFKDCTNLKRIDITNWNTSNASDISDISEIFNGCTSLENFKTEGSYLNRLTTTQNYINTTYCFDSDSIKKEMIENIYFEKKSLIPKKVIKKWDASQYKNEDVIAWISRGTKEGKYDLHLASEDGKFYAPLDSSYLFYGYTNVKKIEGLNNVDVSGAKNMREMFSKCSNLIEVDISNWDTSNVMEMYAMFEGCISLKKVKATNLNLSTSVGSNKMFENCEKLEEIESENWDTSDLKSMDSMFSGCKKLLKLDTSAWDTSNVTDMRWMFKDCESLTFVDVSNWDTSNVEYMDYIFSGCQRLSKIDVDNWDISNVAYMEGMFKDCQGLLKINCDMWNTSNVTDMSSMFENCHNLFYVETGNWNTSKVTDMSSMFSGCKNLPTINVENWDTSNVTNMKEMFKNCCYNLYMIDVSNWDTSKVTSMNSMFLGCKRLTKIDVSAWNTSNLTDLWQMFSECENLYNMDFGGWNLTEVEKQMIFGK